MRKSLKWFQWRNSVILSVDRDGDVSMAVQCSEAWPGWLKTPGSCSNMYDTITNGCRNGGGRGRGRGVEEGNFSLVKPITEWAFGDCSCT